jgi:hypothetical protein
MPKLLTARPEDEFVLRCAREFVGCPDVSCAQAPVGDLDWQSVRNCAAAHRVSPSLDRLAEVGAHKADTRQRVRWNLLLTRELLKVLEVLDRSGIEAIPFKGPLLSSILYADATVRESCDLDILVRPEDAHRAGKALVAAGYPTDLPSDSYQRAAYLRSRYELHFTSPSSRIPIEIHQSFLPSSYCLPLDYEAIWRRAERVPFFGRDVLSLSTADLLLMLCIHGAKHSWAELIYVCDISRLLVKHGNEINWPELSKQAGASGALRILRVGLLLASDVLDVPLPAAFLKEARADAPAIRISRQASRTLFNRQDEVSAFTQYRLFLRTRERLRDRLTSIARLIWSPNEEDYSLLRLPALLSSLYFPIHAIRVAGKYGCQMLRGNN